MLSTAAATVLVGTLYPMFYDLAGLGSLTVGAPYFNSFFAPMSLFAAAAAGFAQLLGVGRFKTALAVCAAAALAVSMWPSPPTETSIPATSL